jgi:olfactory receptor
MVIRKPHFCVLLVLFLLLMRTVDALLHTLKLLQLSYCTSLEISHFFCELTQVIKLACFDILINDILVYLVSIKYFDVPLSRIIFS